MKKLTINYTKKFDINSIKVMFNSKVNSLNELRMKKNLHLIDTTKIDFNSDNFLLYAKLSFVLDAKVLKTLFANYLKQISDKTDIDILLSVKYGYKTLNRLIDIFNNKGFFEAKKADLEKMVTDKFNGGLLDKTATMTVTDNTTIPDFIKSGFISAKLISGDSILTSVTTNNFDDVLNFIK